MRDSFARIVVALALILGIAWVAQPYIERIAYSTDAPRPVTPRADLADIERSTISLFEAVAPSVVQVVAHVGAPRFGEAVETGVASGTGFVWDDVGHIVTNNHVVENASDVSVRMATGQVIRARVLGRAPNYDLAVLRLENAGRLPAPIRVGSSADLKVGQAAFAIGNPFGLDQSLTTGIISALKRRLPTNAGREIAGVIQTDAAINPGNSGGPLLDSAGRLIGVNTAIFSPSGASAGIGFAIPVDVVNRIVPELIRNGRVPTPGIGILAGSEELATRLQAQGVIVARTVPGSPAEKAGLIGIDLARGAVGDIIVAANGAKVRKLSDLTDQLEAVGVGKEVRLTVLRGNNVVDIPVAIVDVDKS